MDGNLKKLSISRRNSSVPDILMKTDGEINLPQMSNDFQQHKQLDSNQERLLNITKSWSELQTKVNTKTDNNSDKNKLNHDDLLEYFNRDKSELMMKFTIDDNKKFGSLKNSSTDIDRRKSDADLKEINSLAMEETVDTQKSIKVNEANIDDESRISQEKINFNKQKLLAAMKAIDNNENIEFISNQKIRETTNAAARSQVTENLYRGLPTHARRRDDIIKDIFADAKVESKLRSGCSKLH